MADERISGYAEALLAVARAEPDRAGVEDELFRFARAFESSDELRSTLTDAQIPAARRQQVVEDLLEGRASRTGAALVSMIIGAGRAGDLPKIIDRMLELSASGRRHSVAQVRSAVPLTAEQERRLAEALKQATGKDVEVKVQVDPTVMGGLITQIDDEIIDGSVRTRLNQLREAFRGRAS